jgi:hypothetical protein
VERARRQLQQQRTPLDPPGVCEGFHGLRQMPLRSDSVTTVVPNSGVFVFARTMNPAPRILRTSAASSVGTCSANARQE